MRRVLFLLQKLPFQHIKVVRFLLSGGVSAALNFSILWGSTELLHVWYMLSLIISIIICSILNFTLQKFWTFEDHSLDRVYAQLPQFITLGVVNLILNSIFLYVLVEYAHMWYLAGQVICIATLASMNFFIYHTLIFSSKGR